MGKTGLSAIRKEIDALDAQMRALLLARARVVEEVARSKAGEPETMPLRPAREMKQMQALADWHASENPPFGLASLLAVWREIIGAALAQQGGLVVHVCGETVHLGRDHFGVAAHYQEHDSANDALRACDANPRSVAVIPLEAGFTPTAPAGVFARLPILQQTVLGEAAALCYGAVPFELDETMVTLACTGLSQVSEVEAACIIGQNQTHALIELAAPLCADEIADKYGASVVWLGNYDLLHVSDGQEK